MDSAARGGLAARHIFRGFVWARGVNPLAWASEDGNALPARSAGPAAAPRTGNGRAGGLPASGPIMRWRNAPALARAHKLAYSAISYCCVCACGRPGCRVFYADNRFNDT